MLPGAHTCPVVGNQVMPPNVTRLLRCVAVQGQAQGQQDQDPIPCSTTAHGAAQRTPVQPQAKGNAAKRSARSAQSAPRAMQDCLQTQRGGGLISNFSQTVPTLWPVLASSGSFFHCAWPARCPALLLCVSSLLRNVQKSQGYINKDCKGLGSFRHSHSSHKLMYLMRVSG